MSQDLLIRDALRHADERVKQTRKQYQAQCARDAQGMRYGNESYWDYLEESSLEHHAKGITDALTQSLAEALQGNDGD